MPHIVRSARGQRVDFELMKIKQKLAGYQKIAVEVKPMGSLLNEGQFVPTDVESIDVQETTTMSFSQVAVTSQDQPVIAPPKKHK